MCKDVDAFIYCPSQGKCWPVTMNVWLLRESCVAVLKCVFQTACFSISEGSQVLQKSLSVARSPYGM